MGSGFRLIIIFAGLLLSGPNLFAQAPEFAGAHKIGNNGDDEAYRVAIDKSGNIYVTGYFSDALDLDPGSGTSMAYASGIYDLFLVKLNAQGQYIWGKTILGNNHALGYALCTDTNGNVYVGGNFSGTADFNPGSGVSNLSSSGATDIFIVKLDSGGDFTWVRSIGGTGGEGLNDIKTDPFGNVYATGTFQGTVDFNPGAGTFYLNSVYNNNAFIFKLNPNGNLIWAKAIGSSGGSYGFKINIDLIGSIYVCGYFNGKADFDPGPDSSFQSGYNSAGTPYVLKLNNLGHFIWASILICSNHGVARGIEIDDDFQVYLSGYYTGTMDFDPDTSDYILSSNYSENGYVCKLDSSGMLRWVHQLGSNNQSERIMRMEIVPGASLYITGFFRITIDFNFDPTISETRTANGWTDVFILKIDSAGKFKWVVAAGGGGLDIIEDIASDKNGELYAVGHYSGTVDFNPGNDTFYLSSPNSDDDGFIWHLSECITNYTVHHVSACSAYMWIDGNTYTSSISGPVDTLVNYKGCDSIVTLNLTINQASTATHTHTACDSFIWVDGHVYYQDTVGALDTLVNKAGCDSVVTLDLNILESDQTTHYVSACDSFTWIDGNLYDSSNQSAYYHFINAAGCDSIVFLDLTINKSKNTVETITACDSFRWVNGHTYYASTSMQEKDTFQTVSGCDSIVTLDLTINYSRSSVDQVSACDSFAWINGVTYYASNQTASHLLSTSSGCDSIIYLDLSLGNTLYRKDQMEYCKAFTWVNGQTYTNDTSLVFYRFTNVSGCDSILELELDITPLNLTISQNGQSLSVSQSGTSYQWFTCIGGGLNLIQSATQSSYTVSGNGQYAVSVSDGNCTDTSGCFTVTGIGWMDNWSRSGVHVYPNPTTGKISLEMDQNSESGILRIFDGTGKQIQSLDCSGTDTIEWEIAGEDGLYWLILETEKGQFRMVLIKNKGIR